MARTRLRKVKLNFVSLVDNPAGVGAEVALFKRDAETEPDEELVKLDGHTPARGRSTLSDTNTLEDSNVGTEQDKDVDLTKMSTEDLISYVRALEDEVIQKDDIIEGIVAELETGDEESGEAPDDGDYYYVDAESEEGEEQVAKSADEILKSSPELAEVFKSLTDRVEAAETVAKNERHMRLQKRFDDEARALSNLPTPEVEISKMLYGAYERDEEEYKTLHDTLTKAHNAVGQSGLFTEIGKSTHSSTSPDLDSAATALRSADPSLSQPQAIAKALENNPDLYIQYLNEKG